MPTCTRAARLSPRLDELEPRLTPSVVVSVDAGAGVHAINPNVYGVAYADQAALADLNVPFNRYGGNNASRYNWQQNADNRAADWYFESIGDQSATPGARGDDFIAASKAAGAQADLTIPMIDWVAKLGANRVKLASFSVAKYGAQQSTDYWFPDAGNGVRTNGQYVTGNDPNDANVPNSVALEQSWVQHLVATWGTASQGGLRYYTLDNEPSIWFSTHRDVHPTGPTMQEVLDKTVAYASMIKAIDPSAVVMGPEEWGWSGYLYSGYDQQYGATHGWSYLPDRAAHGNMDYLPWLLQQIHAQEQSIGHRLLDVFSVHYYPQGGEFSDDVSTATQLLRNRSTRSLWDPNYVDQSWINDKVDLIPRLHGWAATYDPGLQVGLTEYNWGAEGHMNGATTQADLLGIFGREGLDIASRWTTPTSGSPTYNAIKMYRNYDGSHSAFGETSVSATTANPDQLSTFAALRSGDGSLTIMVVNKNLYNPGNPGATTSVTVNLSNFLSGGTAEEWQLLAPNPADMTQSTIRHLSDVSFSGNSFTVSVPMQTVTLFVVHRAAVHPGTLKFASAAYRVLENGRSATVTVSRVNGSDSTVTVHYATADGTARAGTDYTPTSGTLTFGPGQTTATFQVGILDDGSANEPSRETISLTLDNPTGGATLGRSSATLTILETAGGLVVVGPDAGGGPEVKAYDAATLQPVFDFMAYDASVTGGVRVASGDVTGDGIPDIVTAPGPGVSPDVRVFDGANGLLVRHFLAYVTGWQGGVFVAVGDVNHDGVGDIVTGKDAGAGPRVRVFSGKDGTMLQDFLAYDQSFPGGVRVAAGDVNGDGFADIITAAGPGGGPHVEVFSGQDRSMLRSFMAYDPRFGGGVYVAAADTTGTGRASIITTAGSGGAPQVKVWGLSGPPLASFLAYDSAFTGGVRVAAADVNGDGKADILTSPGAGQGPDVRAFDAVTASLIVDWNAYDPRWTSGVFIGG